MAISAALAKVYSTAPSRRYYIEALSIYHSALPKTLHITNQTASFQGRIGTGDETFESIPFEIQQPTKDTSGSQAMNIIISNVEQGIIEDFSHMASQPYEAAVVRYRVFISDILNASGALEQQLKPAWRYDISEFIVNESAIVFVASKTNLHNRSWPKLNYTTTEFPGLGG